MKGINTNQSDIIPIENNPSATPPQEWLATGSLRNSQYDTDRYPQIGFLDNVKIRIYLAPDMGVYIDGPYNPETKTCNKIQVGSASMSSTGKAAKINIFRDTFTINAEKLAQLKRGEIVSVPIAHPNPALKAAQPAA